MSIIHHICQYIIYMYLIPVPRSTSSATATAEPRETRSHTSSPLVTPQTRRLRTSARRTASDTEGMSY
jgi:hypothetical protein